MLVGTPGGFICGSIAVPTKISVNRRSFHDEVERIRVFRNRIAHHELLLKTNHVAELRRLVDLMAIVNSVVAEEIRLDTSIQTLSAQRP